MKGKKILVDGTTLEVEPKNGKYFELKELNTLVNGHVCLYYTRDGRYVVCDDDGSTKRLKVNKLASQLVEFDIKGDVVILDKLPTHINYEAEQWMIRNKADISMKMLFKRGLKVKFDFDEVRILRGWYFTYNGITTYMRYQQYAPPMVSSN